MAAVEALKVIIPVKITPPAAALALTPTPFWFTIVEHALTRDMEFDLLDEIGGVYGIQNVPVPPRDDGFGDWGIFETGLYDDKYTAWVRVRDGSGS
jgi:hypothetical protein